MIEIWYGARFCYCVCTFKISWPYKAYEGQNGLCIICLENDPIFISKGPFWFLTSEMDSFRPNKLKLGQQRHFANAQAHTKNRDHRLPVALMAALSLAFFCINNLESTVPFYSQNMDPNPSIKMRLKTLVTNEKAYSCI